MKISTKRGDEGKTDLFSGERVSKSNLLVSAYGTVDELNSWLGLIKSKANKHEVSEVINKVQQDLFIIGAELASLEKENLDQVITEENIKYLEENIENFEEYYDYDNNFTVSGDSEMGSLLDIARTIARRTERKIIKASQKNEVSKELLSYINRLSDLLFLLARTEDIWKKVESLVKKKLLSEEVEGNSKPELDLELAEKIVSAAREKAADLGVPVAVSIVDKAGDLINFIKMDDALPISIKLSPDKAYTAVRFEMSTEQVGQLAQPGADLYGIEHNSDRIVTFGGGLPLKIDEEIVGGIGVSGGKVEEDIKIAQSAREYLKKLVT